MKKYREYMDNVRASDTLHQRLAELKEPGKRPIPWAKYGTLAAALALVLGLGAWGLSAGLPWVGYDEPLVDWAPENATAGVPDIAIVEPGDVTEPGKKTLGGYEVTSGGVTAYYTLPYIDYSGMKPSAASQVPAAADWDIPQGAVKRDLDREEIIALMGGEDALSTHLDWGGYELTGWAAWYEDGSFWGAYIMGHAGELDHFEFSVTADQMPPSCIVYSEGVTQEIRGLTVIAEGHDSAAGPGGGVDASTRRVSFMKDDYGYRFDLTGASRALTEERVSRLVCCVADERLALSYDCPYCGHTFPFGTAHHHPLISADGSYTCSNCGQFVPAGEKHSHTFIGEGGVPDQDGTPVTETCPNCGAAYPVGSGHDCAMCDGYPAPHVCEVCGATYPEGTAHSHEACGYPLAPDTETCPDCGVTYPAGEAHYHTHTCEVCGQALPAGVEHSHGVTCPDCGESYAEGTAHTCRQEGHHQEGHHGGHH